MGACDTSILSNLPKPSPRPLTSHSCALHPSVPHPLPAQPECFDTGSSFAHGPGSVPAPLPPPPLLTRSPNSSFQPSGSWEEGQGRKREKPRFLPSGPFSSSVNGDLHSPLLLAGTLNRKVK